MSANLDLVRAIHADWERGDFSSTDWVDAGVELEFVGGPTPGSWQGLRATSAAWRGFVSAWENFRVEVDEFRELDGERILAFAHFSARGKSSGVELEQVRQHQAALFHVRAGRVTRVIFYWDRDRALADLGLEK